MNIMNTFLMVGIVIISIYLIYRQYVIRKNGGKMSWVSLISSLLCFVCACALIVIKLLGLV